jgi:hypothetical protein
MKFWADHRRDHDWLLIAAATKHLSQSSYRCQWSSLTPITVLDIRVNYSPVEKLSNNVL